MRNVSVLKCCRAHVSKVNRFLCYTVFCAQILNLFSKKDKATLSGGKKSSERKKEAENIYGSTKLEGKSLSPTYCASL